MATKKKPDRIPVDSQWFTDRLAERRLSLRGLAKLMEMSPSSLSLRLNGRYKITMEEATVMANLLGVTFEEIVLRAGIKVPKDPSRSVRVVGHVTAGVVKMTKTGGSVARPIPLPGGVVAIKGGSIGVARGVEGGWTFFYNPSHKLQPEAVGQLSVVEGVSQTWLGVLERGSERGSWNVRGVFGGGVEGVKVGCASPVLLILP